MLWQIKNNYEVNAAGCSECYEFWRALEQENKIKDHDSFGWNFGLFHFIGYFCYDCYLFD
jgi:hypothetical protein